MPHTSYTAWLRRGWAVILMLLGLVALDAVSPVGLSYNHTPSLPRGLYWHKASAPPYRVGQQVCFHYIPPEWAVNRSYAPSDALVCKQVLGVAGERIERSGDQISICNVKGCRDAGAVLAHDHEGRPVFAATLPQSIPAGMLYLGATRVPNSFDSRYLGLIAESRVVREVFPLWTE